MGCKTHKLTAKKENVLSVREIEMEQHVYTYFPVGDSILVDFKGQVKGNISRCQSNEHRPKKSFEKEAAP